MSRCARSFWNFFATGVLWLIGGIVTGHETVSTAKMCLAMAVIFLMADVIIKDVKGTK